MLNKTKLKERLQEIISSLNSLKNDEGLPKNIKAKIDTIISELNTDDNEVSAKVGKALHILDEISEDLNIQPFIRTQIWNISSMFEKLNN
jgi:uncharacterized protein (UPF0147 family)